MRDQRVALSRRYHGGYTQAEVAKKLSISRVGYAHYELGHNDVSSVMLQKIAAVLETTIDYLLGQTPMGYAPHVVDFVQRFSGEDKEFWGIVGDTAEFLKLQKERLAMAVQDDSDDNLLSKF